MSYKRDRKAQITLFIIIAIIIVATALATFFVFRDKIFKRELPQDILFIKEYAQNCLEETSRDAVMFIGMQGGFFNPQPAVETETTKIAYWVYDNQNQIPEIGQIEKEVSYYADTFLPLCTMAFFVFQDKFDIDEGPAATTALIKNNQVIFNVKWPLTISRKEDNAKYRIEEFSTAIPVNLNDIYYVAAEIADEEIEHDYINIQSLTETEFDIAIMPYDETTIYSISDAKSLIYNKPYTFTFAVK